MDDFAVARTAAPDVPVAGIPLDLYADVPFAAASASQPFSLANLFDSAWRHRVALCAVFASCMAVAILVVLTLRPTYQSDATLVIDPRQNHLSDLPLIQDGAATLSDLNFVRTEMQLLASDDLARQVVIRLGLQNGSAFQKGPPDADKTRQPAEAAERAIDVASARYKDRLGTFTDGKSFIISAWFNARDPAFAQRVLQTHLALFQADQVAAKRTTIARAEAWFAQELHDLNAKLLGAEAKQLAYQQSSQVFRASGETSAGRQLVTVTNQLAEARTDLAAKEARAGELAGGRRADTASLSSDLLQKLREQEAEVAQQVASLQERSGSQYPPLAAARRAQQEVQSRIARESARIGSAASSDLAIARSNVAALQHEFDLLTARLGATRGDELSAAQFQSEIDVDRRLYDDLLARSQQVAIQDQLQEPDTRIVSDASLPLTPQFPRKGMLLAISATASAMLAVLVTALIDARGRNLSRTLADVEAACRLPGLGVIPLIRGRKRRRAMKLEPGSAFTAAVHKLRNSIALRRDGERTDVTVFVSATPGEGKSTIAALYARSLAAPGTRILLIDADLRRAGLSRAFGLSPNKGLSQCLAGARLSECVRANVLPGLDMLAAQPGSDDPAALLSAERVRSLLDAAATLYAAIVIDVPPILPVDDCLHLVRQAGATVLVARWGQTPLPVLARAVRRLRLAGAELIGAVLNGADLRQLQTYDGALYAQAFPSVYLLQDRAN